MALASSYFAKNSSISCFLRLSADSMLLLSAVTRGSLSPSCLPSFWKYFCAWDLICDDDLFGMCFSSCFQLRPYRSSPALMVHYLSEKVGAPLRSIGLTREFCSISFFIMSPCMEYFAAQDARIHTSLYLPSRD